MRWNNTSGEHDNNSGPAGSRSILLLLHLESKYVAYQGGTSVHENTNAMKPTETGKQERAGSFGTMDIEVIAGYIVSPPHHHYNIPLRAEVGQVCWSHVSSSTHQLLLLAKRKRWSCAAARGPWTPRIRPTSLPPSLQSPGVYASLGCCWWGVY